MCRESELRLCKDSRIVEFGGMLICRRRKLCDACGAHSYTIEVPEASFDRMKQQIREDVIMKLAGMLE